MSKQEDHIETIISKSWSQFYEKDKFRVSYRLWQKKGKTYCLKLTKITEEDYQLEISSSLENIDQPVGVIFEIPDFPFDSQYKMIKQNKKYVLINSDGESYKQNAAKEKLKELFNYKHSEELFLELFKGTGIKY